MLSSTKSRLDGKTFLQTLFFFLLTTQICFAQWYQQNSGTMGPVIEVAFSDASNGIVVCNPWGPNPVGEILRTTDGGTHWLTCGFYGWVRSVSHADANTYFAVGGDRILKTTDCGLQWTQETIANATLWDVHFANAENGLAIGYSHDSLPFPRGYVIRTTDGGVSWTNQTCPSNVHLWGVFLIDNTNGWIVGNTSDWSVSGGVILKTTNGGTTWIEQWSTTTFGLTNIHFGDVNNGWAIGSEGKILKTTNGGTVWVEQSIAINQELWGLYSAGANTCWIVGADGLILKTNDGGANWNQQISGTTNWLFGVYFIDANNGWAVGGDGTDLPGTILHTTNGGVTFVEEEQIDEMPTQFLLSQNYPNPFNPSTKIKYSIPPVGTQHAVAVQIKVYDVLGNEIETLVSEEKPAGTYEVTWNAASLPSGIYFYQIRAGSYIETKKMLLLK